ncbi:MAG: restriction endonuclease [Methanoregula sp.]
MAGLDAVAEGTTWQNFERLAGFIFEMNGFAITVGTVKTRNRKRRQYDVIARKNDRTLLVECKQWSGSRYRLSALKKAVIQHRERALFYESVTNENAVPIIVTLIEEEIRIFEGVPLVPVHRLNTFIGELENFPDGISSGEFEDLEEGITEQAEEVQPDPAG